LVDQKEQTFPSVLSQLAGKVHREWIHVWAVSLLKFDARCQMLDWCFLKLDYRWWLDAESRNCRHVKATDGRTCTKMHTVKIQ
jgi:hypothetical protein